MAAGLMLRWTAGWVACWREGATWRMCGRVEPSQRGLVFLNGYNSALRCMLREGATWRMCGRAEPVDLGLTLC
jgi:hypothetical protein